MIRINLLPPEFRKETNKRWFIPSPRVIKMLGVAFLGVTFLFYAHYLFGIRGLKKLQAQWMSVQNDSQRVDALKKKIEEGSKSEKTFLENNMLSSVQTAFILQRTSELLPDLTWLEELRVTRESKENTFQLKGYSLPSPAKSSIQEIEKYLRAIKECLPKEATMNLKTTRQTKGKQELTFFTVVYKWP